MIYKQIVNADALSDVIAIPQIFRNRRVEVIIREAPEAVSAPKIDMENIGRMMGGSITQSLIGIVPNSGKTLDDYRSEITPITPADFLDVLNHRESDSK